ncbi:MAG: hypothetical protein HYU66_04335 [Armatimonadetes bacterium]|nr:hypothetical protein [Armatimonadota bacterium]
MVTDRPPVHGIGRPGAPAHVIGLELYSHQMVLDTGARHYGLMYCVAFDKQRPGVAIPGEGYIGMPEPCAANWYHGGFFDLQINGQSLGSTPIHAMTGRATGARGYIDFVFDAPQAVVRVHFVALAGGDALYCQALLEPKAEVKSLRVAVRCYPSAFISNADRHVLTPVRDIPQGQRAELDVAKENWLLYYDRIYDAGYIAPGATGAGGCSVLWPASQADKVSFGVGSYGIDTAMDLKPQLRELRFVFFDYTGRRNQDAIADLRARAEGLGQELAGFAFTDDQVARWPLADKVAEVQKVLATMPEEQEAAASYQRWTAELGEQLKLVQAGNAGAILAEATAADTIGQWERGLPALRLKALLNGI